MSDFIRAEEYCVAVKDGTHNSPKKTENGVKLATSKNIIGGNLDLSTAYFISEEDANEVNKRSKVDKNDILISMIGTVGEVCLIKDDPDFVIKNVGLLKNKCAYKAKWLYFYLKTNQAQNLIKERLRGTTQQYLSLGELRNFPVLLPKNEDHLKNAVNILWELEQKIQLNTQINQTLEQIAQTIFKSWFIDFDPVHAKANALASGQTTEQATQAAMAVISGKNTQELHRLQTANPTQYQQLWKIAEAFPSGFDEEGVPWGWESKPLDEIAIYQNGLALQKFRPESEDEYLPVVKIAQLKQGYADGKEKASVNIKPECIIDNGDVIFSWSGSLVVDIWCGGKAALNQHLFKVTSKNYPKWLYYFYTVHHLAEFQRIAADKAVTMGHIKREHLSLALCVIPNNEFIQKFCFLEDYISQIVNNRLQNVSLIKIRDELLPKLLSGEV